MASGDNVDVIEVVETTNLPGSTTRPAVDHLRPDQSTAEEDCECALMPRLLMLPSSPLYPSPFLCVSLVPARRDPNLQRDHECAASDIPSSLPCPGTILFAIIGRNTLVSCLIDPRNIGFFAHECGRSKIAEKSVVSRSDSSLMGVTRPRKRKHVGIRVVVRRGTLSSPVKRHIADFDCKSK